MRHDLSVEIWLQLPIRTRLATNHHVRHLVPSPGLLIGVEIGHHKCDLLACQCHCIEVFDL